MEDGEGEEGMVRELVILSASKLVMKSQVKGRTEDPFNV